MTAAFGLAGVAFGGRSLYAQELTQTYSRKQADLGPRALGLVQLSSTGKARLVPIVIMLDGKFYDAGSYKAAPVPMALDFGIVYEGFKTGVSQGTFTITQPGQLNHNWIAEGTWLPAGVKAPSTTKKYAAPVIDDNGSKDDRPVLHRRAEGAADKDEAKPAASSTQASSPPASSTTTPSGSAPASTGSGTASSQAGSPPAAQPPSTPSASASTPPPATAKDDSSNATKPAVAAASTKPPADEPISDPNRPRLRRGKPDPNAHHEPFVDFDAQEAAAKSTGAADTTASKDAVATVQTVTAISDAGGPDPRPYTYDLKPAEEAIYRNKMLEMAAKLVKLKAGQNAAAPSTAATKAGSSSARTKTATQAKPQFENLNLRIFDLSSSNEPVLVLSARTPVPPAGASGAQVPQEITLIARTNLEGELHKLFFAQTDSPHLDVSPRMELIDAVDADGDGRGELLFRKTSDAGSAYAIYRVTADQLWPLYEGTP